MAPFDRSYMTLCWSATCIVLSCTVFELFGVEYRELEIRVRGQRNWYIRKLGYSFLFAFHSNYGSYLAMLMIHCLKSARPLLFQVWYGIVGFNVPLDIL